MLMQCSPATHLDVVDIAQDEDILGVLVANDGQLYAGPAGYHLCQHILKRCLLRWGGEPGLRAGVSGAAQALAFVLLGAAQLVCVHEFRHRWKACQGQDHPALVQVGV